MAVSSTELFYTPKLEDAATCLVFPTLWAVGRMPHNAPGLLANAAAIPV